MNGRSSRNKGKRGEYEVRDHLRGYGLQAHRVPSSGAAQGFKGDVVAKDKNNKEYVFEVKLRKEGFKTVYTLYESKKDDNGIFSVWYNNTGITIANNAIKALDNSFYKDLSSDIKTQTLNKIYNLQKFLKGAHVLVIKDNNKPLLFIRFEMPIGNTGN